MASDIDRNSTVYCRRRGPRYRLASRSPASAAMKVGHGRRRCPLKSLPSVTVPLLCSAALVGMMVAAEIGRLHRLQSRKAPGRKGALSRSSEEPQAAQ